MRRTNIVLVMVVIAVSVTTWALLGTAVAQKAVPKPQDKLAIGEDEVKRLLPLMDQDKDGKVSKQEFMRFMEAEFARLDKKKEGKLDIKELTPSTPIRGFRK